MFGFFNKWLNRRIIKHSTITPEEWRLALASLPLLEGLSEDELQHLKELSILFINAKEFEG
ncbi:MAG: zinc-dependent peptidase, partial [Gammaproteobacteria bacterium]|nr:zinc-dependent peptidase [Gammaproteobacteria bacterium]